MRFNSNEILEPVYTSTMEDKCNKQQVQENIEKVKTETHQTIESSFFEKIEKNKKSVQESIEILGKTSYIKENAETILDNVNNILNIHPEGKGFLTDLTG